MKKIISLLLIASMLFCFVACNQSNSESEKSTETTETTEIETTAPHTEHDVEKGKCSVCGLDYFEELKKLILNYGDYDTKTQGWDYKVKHQNALLIIRYKEKENQILLGYTEQNKDIVCFWSLWLYLDKTSIKQQQYDWYFGKSLAALAPSSGDSGNISGVLDATSFSKTTNALTYSNNTFTSNSVAAKYAQEAADELEIIITNAFLPLLEKGTEKITPAHFGFERFE